MTIATSAPVISPSIATPNRMSSQAMILPAVEVTKAEIALTEDGRDPPVERVEERFERPGLLDRRDQQRGQQDEGGHPLREGEEEPAIHLPADPLDVPRHAPDER